MNSKRVERMIRETDRYPSSIAYALVLATAGMALTLSSQAQERRELVIQSIVAETGTSMLVLEGRHFVDGSAKPLVYLGGGAAPLPISKLSERSITVQLPASLPAANYMVRVSRGSQPGDSAEKAIDVGIVGPAVSEH